MKTLVAIILIGFSSVSWAQQYDGLICDRETGQVKIELSQEKGTATLLNPANQSRFARVKVNPDWMELLLQGDISHADGMIWGEEGQSSLTFAVNGNFINIRYQAGGRSEVFYDCTLTLKSKGGLMEKIKRDPASSALSVDVCSNYDGSFMYDSATTLGDTVVVENPVVLIAGSKLLLKTNTGKQNAEMYGTGICRALGYRDGIVTDIQSKPREKSVAELNSAGELIAVTPPASLIGNNFRIKTAVCKK